MRRGGISVASSARSSAGIGRPRSPARTTGRYEYNAVYAANGLPGRPSTKRSCPAFMPSLGAGIFAANAGCPGRTRTDSKIYSAPISVSVCRTMSTPDVLDPPVKIRMRAVEVVTKVWNSSAISASRAEGRTSHPAAARETSRKPPKASRTWPGEGMPKVITSFPVKAHRTGTFLSTGSSSKPLTPKNAARCAVIRSPRELRIAPGESSAPAYRISVPGFGTV